MAIYAVTGSPGSGKSYYAVSQIKKILDSGENCLILTNIAGLKIDDNRLHVMSFSQEGFASTKQAPYLRQLREKYGLGDDEKIYYFIDEAQQYLSGRLRSDDVIYFFDTHRHYGVDIYLMSQNIRKIHKDITALCEYETRASALTINPLPGFFYRKYAGGEQFATFRLNKKNEIFALYKSMEAGTTQKKNKKYVFIVGALVLVVGFSGYAFMNSSVVSSSSSKKAQARAVPDTKNMEKNSDKSSSSDSSDGSDFNNDVKNIDIFNSDSIDDMKENISALPNDLPNIVEYNSKKDAVKVNPDTAGKYFIAVSKFLNKYDPFLSGISYIHVPHDKFIILSKNSDKILFPKDKMLPHRKKIQSDDEGESKQKGDQPGRDDLKIARAAEYGVLDDLSLTQQAIRYGPGEVAEWYGITNRHLQRITEHEIYIDSNQGQAASVRDAPKRGRAVAPARDAPKRQPSRSGATRR